MKYENRLLLANLLLLFAVLVAGCAGPEGPPGPAGETGAAGPQGPAGPPGDDASVRLEFVGSEKCAACHESAYQKFALSGHPYKLTKIVDGQPPAFPYDNVTGGVTQPPEGYSWDQISYVIGGFAWKARFIDQDGYIITGDSEATTQWNFANPDADLPAGWSAYHAGEQKPYDCGACHTTGYRPDGHQDDLEGIVGTWAFPGIQCEACHGPGSLHSADPYGHLMVVDRSNQLCGSCHVRGDPASIDASGGFIRHHEQYDEMFNSTHFSLQCITCHDPHASALFADATLNPTASIRQTCESCHWQEIFKKTDKHGALECVDCHMPLASKSAQGNPEIFTGDVHSHLFSINPDPEAPQFNEDGSVAMPYLTLNYACNHCHGPFATVKDAQQLGEMASGYHTPPEPAPIAVPEPTTGE